MIKLKDLLNEMPMITKKGKNVFANDVPLKDMKVDDVIGNIVIIRQSESGGFVQQGWTVVYFMDTEESAEEMKRGNIPYLMIPIGTFMSGGSPITDVWKKKFQKPGTEHILGLLQGHSDENTVFVDMLSVRAGYQRNSIASKLVDVLKQRFPSAKITHSSPTDKGKAFLKSRNELDPKFHS